MSRGGQGGPRLDLVWLRNSSSRMVACKQPPQAHFGKDGIPWEGPHVEQGQRGTVEEQQVMKC